MKTFCLTTTIAVFFLICSNGIQAQTTETKLNQVELMKQLIGTWKGEFTNKDSFIIAEMKSFGNGGVEGNQTGFFKEKIFFEQKLVSGYDKKSD